MMKTSSILLTFLLWAGLASNAIAAIDTSNSTTGVNGYDLVSYQTGKRPLRGNGHFLSVHEGVTYLFISEENKKKFDSNPDKYVPVYGGYCAFGTSVGKKFVGDPEVWRIVDGRLYLNLDENIQDMWLQDVPGRIKTADANWKKIKNISPAEL